MNIKCRQATDSPHKDIWYDDSRNDQPSWLVVNFMVYQAAKDAGLDVAKLKKDADDDEEEARV